MAKKTPIKKSAVSIHYPEQLQTIYTNFAQLGMSPNDLSIDFGVRKPEIDMKNPPAFISLRVMMSPQHAKLLAQRLSKIIEDYEKDFGEIRTEPIKK